MAVAAGDWFLMLRPGLYSGVVIARSSETPARDHTYTVDISTGGADPVQFAGVAPHPNTRWSTAFPDLDLIPFPLGTLVTVHVFGRPPEFQAFIETSELPFTGECEPAP
jgi:hypothetical protein